MSATLKLRRSPNGFCRSKLDALSVDNEKANPTRLAFLWQTNIMNPEDKAKPAEPASAPNGAAQPLSANRPTLLPRAEADVVNEGLNRFAPDDEPVTVVNMVTLDGREIETIEREFGGRKLHAIEAPFDIFATPQSPPSPISGSAQALPDPGPKPPTE